MEDRATVLRDLKICRLCLDENGPFVNIYTKDSNETVPFPLLVAACASIEIYPSDGLPSFVCKSCKNQSDQFYTFKINCRKAEDALKLYSTTGTLIKPVTLQQSGVKRKHVFSTSSQESSPRKVKSNESHSSNFVVTSIPLQESKVDTQPNKEHHVTLEIVDYELGPGHQTNFAEPKEFEYENDDSMEKSSQVETNLFPCPHCERSFPLQQLLDIHIKNHERERKFECEECSRKFFSKYDLGKHVLLHLENKTFACVVCKKQFNREALLHRHEKVHTQAPKYMCNECDRTFLSSEDLDVHVEKHKKRRPFACRLCNKSFVFKQGLERHELSHADQKPHKCNYCEASFTSPIKLTRHITSHAGLRPYPCKLCGRTFLLSHHLTRHMRTHYAAKSPHSQPIGQYKCDMCSMSFRRKDSLINHSAIHSMVNLKCVICNTEFESAKVVKDHITTHLAGLPYPCDKCDYSFESQDQLEEHELKHAEMEYEEQIEKEVTQEMMQQGQMRGDHNMSMGDDGDEFMSAEEEDMTQFSIMSADNLEIIRRSKREKKVKNFADFLRDEIGTDDDDDEASREIKGLTVEDNEDDEDDLLYKPSSATTTSAIATASVNETIKPVVRTEGTKMYTRKTPPEKPKVLPTTAFIPPTETDQSNVINDLPLLDNINLNKGMANAFPPDKNYVDMKIGNKLVRVQKLIMSKAEIEAMAKEGKIERKGNTILLKKKSQPIVRPKRTLNESIDSIFNEQKGNTEGQEDRQLFKKDEKGSNKEGNNVAEPEIILSLE